MTLLMRDRENWKTGEKRLAADRAITRVLLFLTEEYRADFRTWVCYGQLYHK